MTDYRDISAQLTKRSERCVLTGYPDQGGIATWGWGHTGPEVRIGQDIPQSEADVDFTRDQARADVTLHKHVPPDAFAKLSGHEAAALLDFTFNTGGGPEKGDQHEWHIWSVVRSGDLAAVPDELNRFVYVHVDGKPVTSRGLKNRRTAEVVLWNTADVEAAVATACAGGETVCSASIRELPTPPIARAPKALAKTSLGLKISTALSGAGAVTMQAAGNLGDHAQRVHDIVAAHADMPYAAPVASTLAAVVVCCAVGSLFIHDVQQKKAQV